MSNIAALIRATFLSATSYRVGMALSAVGLIVTFVPIYFVSGALQPVVQESIRTEGGHFFGFLVLGMAATYLLTAAVSAVPGIIASSVASGTLEAILVTRASLAELLIGMAGYGILWNFARSVLLVTGAWVFGAHVSWGGIPLALVFVVFLVLAYFALGLLGGAFVLAFRTSGPFTTVVIAGSTLLGGAYYSTAVIPSWLKDLSAIVPLTYGLRGIRMLVLNDASSMDVVGDLLILATITVVLFAVSGTAFALALRYARKAGTLSQY